jgi:hypothetical protein
LCNALNHNDLLLNNDAKGDYGGTLKEAKKWMITDNHMPDNSLINEAYTEKFIRRFRGYENASLISIYDNLPEMQENMKEKAEWVASLVDRGIYTRNMALEEMGKEKSVNGEMDQFTVKDDVIPLDEALNNDFIVNDPQGI